MGLNRKEAPFCAALGCIREVRPGLLMCPGHWNLVPAPARLTLMGAFRRDMSDLGYPDRRYARACADAIAEVARSEGKAALNLELAPARPEGGGG